MNAINKVGEITVGDLAEFLRIDDPAEDGTLGNLLTVARAFIRDYTGLNDEEIDLHPDFVVVALVLVQDMFDNRCLYVDTTNINHVVETILGMHRVNLL